ncbi:hypothetical protein [Amycolatopsis benzoatilytica]|uniref:hypothetical protein n=1 Tax=Amycolatopsis benzoatilytica TaxID=346045 RepID=UPI000376D95B|nr:hypothetical protein [Amycolatopsis benzoatilytica]
MTWDRIKFWGMLVVFAGLLVLSIVSLNTSGVTCGGQDMHAGDTCITSGTVRGQDEQASENGGRDWIGVAIGGVGVLGYAVYGAFQLRDRRKKA